MVCREIEMGKVSVDSSTGIKKLGEKNSNDFTVTLVNMPPDQISMSKQVEPSTFPLPPPPQKKKKKKKRKKVESKDQKIPLSTLNFWTLM